MKAWTTILAASSVMDLTTGRSNVVEAGNNTDRHNDDTWSAIDNRLSTTTPRIRAESLTRIDTDRTDMSRTVILSTQNFEPSHMTSVLPGLSRKRLPSSQSLTSAIHFESLSIWLVEP